MSSSTPKLDNSPTTSGLSNWLSYKRKRFWMLLAVLLYTILGFFIAPLIVENKLVSMAEQDLGRTAKVENIDINPFVLSLRIEGFELDDKDQVPLASFSGFFINFQLSSLFNRAWTFAEISLDEPFFLFERFDQTNSRLSRLVADFSSLHPQDSIQAAEDNDTKAMPRLLIHDLRLSNGRVDVIDRLPENTVETQLSPINISMQSLNTLPDKAGTQSVTIQLADNAVMKWDGSISLGPLDSKGELALENLRLDPSIAYLDSSVPLESISATLSTRFDYHVFMDLGGQPEINISNFTLELQNVALSGLTPTTEFLDIPDIRLSGGQFQYPEQTLGFAKLVLDKPKLKAWLTEAGELNLLDLLPANENTIDDQDAASANQQWAVNIDEIELTNGLVEITDKSTKPAANLDIQDLNFSLSDVNNQPGATMPVQLAARLKQGGSFNVDGAIQLLPELTLTSQLKINDLPLDIGQPYVQQFARIRINEGTVDSDMELNFSAEGNLAVAGSVRIPALNISNQQDDSKLLSWNSLEIDQFEYAQNSHKLSMSKLTFEQLYGIFVLDENKETNIAGLLIEQPGEAEGSVADPLGLVIGGISINDSSMDFSDLSLPLPFATYIVNLEGNISIIDNSSDVPANINLEGQVDEFGLARINGSINVFDPIKHTDMDLKFRNLLMSNLSPYTVEFAGREIDQGKLDLELGYNIKEGMLEGTNNVVLSELELGQKVDHPGASSLPLALAVSLLKDSDGVIKVDLPVAGDINDPEFRIGGVIWQAISGFIGKIASAPFKLLGSLIGMDSEELGEFEFLPGRFDLTPPEMEKVAQLKQALQQRPELVIEIAGVFDRNMDAAALKKAKLIATATEILGEDIDAGDDQTIMLDQRLRDLVAGMFRERFPDVDTESIRAEFTSTPDPDSKEKVVVDELAYAHALWDRLLDSESISDDELAALAGARAQSIREAFISDGVFSESRVQVIGPKEVEADDQTWIKLELSVASE